MLTHPHVDHFSGMASVLQRYRGKIATFVSFPALRFILEKRAKLRELFEKKIKNLDGSLPGRFAEFLEILDIVRVEAKRSDFLWEEYAGPRNDLLLEGFQGTQCEVLQPLPRVRGDYFHLIEQEDLGAITGDKPNAISLAMRLTSAGTSVVLGGDTTYMNWYHHRHQMISRGFRVDATAWKIPHHGSRDDVKPDMFEYWFASANTSNQRIGVISADGRRHPYPEVLAALRNAGIHPYCTNLARPCGGSKVDALFTSASLPKDLSRFINSGEVELPSNATQPCQGDIHVNVDAQGRLSVTPEFAHPCGFRGDFASLGL
jgi:hypothetical protein